MELIVRVERRRGEETRVVVARAGTGFTVRVGERLYEVDRQEIGSSVRSLIIAGRQHDVAVRHRGGGRYEVSSASSMDRVEVLDRLTHLAEKTHGQVAASGVDRTDAYMPGRVVELLVEQGATVGAGQGVLVLEAMKMENEIQADRAGVVKSFFVEPGQAVEGGDPLYELE